MLSVLVAAIPCLLLPSSLPGDAAHLRVVAVVRQGLPPYEDGDRLYRIEGKGASFLRVGEKLLLQRKGEASDLGKLKVVEIHGDFALAALEDLGETYPLKGDLVFRIEPLSPLPLLPSMGPEAMPRPSALIVTKPTREAPKEEFKGMPRNLASPVVSNAIVSMPNPQPVTTKRQAIFFLKESASLSPGAFEKLKTIVGSWGVKDRWVLGYPVSKGSPPALQQDRLNALRAELQRLGLESPEVRLLPAETPGKYDVVYVMCEPR
jgi:hypothetical protein